MKLITDCLHALKSVALLPFWWSQSLIKRDLNLWTFGAWDGFRYSDNSRALYEFTIEHYPNIKCVWMTNRRDIYFKLRKSRIPVALFYSPRGVYLQIHAGYFYGTKGMCDGVQWCMNGIHFVNLWHGVPIKIIGEDAMERIREHNTFKKIKTKIRRYIVPWEFKKGMIVCGSPFFVPFFKSAFAVADSQLIKLPEPRLDILLANKNETLIDKIISKYNNPTIVFYMPTFRDAEFGTFNPFAHASFNKEYFTKTLENNNIVFIYKGHFYDSTVLESHKDNRIIYVGDDDYDNLYSFLSHVNILITDYSSVYFDFLYLKKPIILFPFDLNDYNINSRDFYFDYNLMQAIRVYTWNELADCLSNKTYYLPNDTEIQLFRPIPAVNCCKNIVDFIIKDKSHFHQQD